MLFIVTFVLYLRYNFLSMAKKYILPQVRVDKQLHEATHKKAHEMDKPVGFIIEKSLRLVLGVKEETLEIQNGTDKAI